MTDTPPDAGLGAGTDPGADPATSETQATPLWAKLGNIIAAPGEVFDEIRALPVVTANWLVPTLLVIVAGWVGLWLVFQQDSIDQQIRDMQEQQIQKLVQTGKMSQQQADASRATVEKFAKVGKIVGGVVGSGVTTAVSLLWWAFVFWLVGGKLMHGGFSYVKAMEAAGLASMILLLETVVRNLLQVTCGNLFAGPNLALLVVEEFHESSLGGLLAPLAKLLPESARWAEYDVQDLKLQVLAALDGMVFWGLVVKAVALSRLSGRGFGKALAWIVGIWVTVSALMMAGGYALQKAFGGG